MSPSVPFAGPGEVFPVVQPDYVVVDIEKCLVGLGHEIVKLHGPYVSVVYFVCVLQAVELLNHQSVSTRNELHPGQVIVSWISGNGQPAGLRPVNVHVHYADTGSGVGGAGFGIGQWNDSGIYRVDVVYHIECARTAGVELPVCDAAAVGTPAPAVLLVQLLLIDPVELSVDDLIAAVEGKLAHGTVGQVVLIYVGDHCPVGRELGELHRCRLEVRPSQLAQLSGSGYVEPVVASFGGSPDPLGIGVDQKHGVVCRPTVSVYWQWISASFWNET